MKNITTKSLLAALLGLAMVPAMQAQDDGGFDLNSQRSEIQNYWKVPGHVVDHGGLVINPTPHKIERPYTGVFNISGGFKVNDKQKAFSASDLSFLEISPKHGLQIDIDFGPKVASKAGVKDVSGAYALSIGPKKITINAYDERGAFYALQTLRQILESPVVEKEGGLPMMEITDYPALPYRGLVEGFYGTPWSHEVRKGLINFMGQNKMNNYLYGPKDDPYHSSPNWRQPYPPEEAANIADLVKTANENRLDFYWAIHPGKDIRWDKADYDSLVNKFNMMYDLGVRSFALFFDDIEGIGTDSHMQTKLLNDLTRDFVDAKGDVSNLIICPTDYSQLWANPGENGQLAIYGRELNPKAEVFWTGAVVCSDLTPETLEFVDSRIKRPALYWWNFPVTDYCRNIVLQGPVYGLDTSLTSEQVAGIESNPMEHGEASKLALYGVADWSWNPADYNAIDNWERGLTDLVPNARDAYRTFAIHSADTETGYRRDESWETTTFTLDEYTPEKAKALRDEFERVASVPARMENGCDNKLLMNELRPWLVEFGKLGQRGVNTIDLMETYRAGNDSVFWAEYVTNRFTPEQRADWEAHKSGTMKLQPFIDNATTDMLIGFYTRVSGNVPMFFRGTGSYPNLPTTLANLMFDGNPETFWTSARSQGENDWVGVDLGDLRMVDSIYVQQGRNSVDDVDFFDNVVLQASPDRRVWTELTEPLVNTYEISWSGKPVQARYVRLLRLPSKRSNWTSVREFKINPPSASRLGFDITAFNMDNALLGFDANPSSAASLASSPISFGIKTGVKKIILLTDATAKNPVKVAFTRPAGGNISTVRVTTPYITLSVPDGAGYALVSGAGASLYEVIQMD